MQEHTLEMDTNKRDNAFTDPELEAALTVISGIVIPLATALYQVIVQKRRYFEEDRRAIRTNLEAMRAALNVAENGLDECNNIIVAANLTHTNRWPSGNHGVQLSPDQYERFMRVVVEITSALRRADEAGMELSGFSNPSKQTALWFDELSNLQALLSRIETVSTYGEWVKHLRWALRISRNVLDKVEQAYETYTRIR